MKVIPRILYKEGISPKVNESFNANRIVVAVGNTTETFFGTLSDEECGSGSEFTQINRIDGSRVEVRTNSIVIVAPVTIYKVSDGKNNGRYFVLNFGDEISFDTEGGLIEGSIDYTPLEQIIH